MEASVTRKGSSLAYSLQAEKEDDYHVMWQASQGCLAFNQLLKTPENDLRSSSSGSSSRGWQRQESFDQIPGFSLLSTKDGDNSSPSQSNPASSGARSSRQPVARARHSDARTPTTIGDASTSTNPLQIPLFDKASPAQFLDILKGVSALVDENAGFKRSGLSGSGLPSKKTPRTSRKRPRPSSLSSSSEVKKGRMEGPRAHTPNESAHDHKGKAKAPAKADSGSRGKNLRGHQSMSSVLEPGDSSFQDEKTLVEDTSMDVDVPKERTFLRTPSQDVMPPPPGLPLKQPRFSQQASSTKLHPSPLLQPPDPHSLRSSTNSSIKPANLTTMKKTEATPTLHHLLQQEPPPKSTQSSIIPPPAFIRRTQAQNLVDLAKPQDSSVTPVVAAPALASPEVETKPPLPTQVSSTKRAPVLGMRRASTYPNGSSTTNAAPQRKTGSLPTKPKAFKPPLLASQPTRSQQRPAPVVKQESNLVKPKLQPLEDATRHRAEQSPPLQPPTSSNGSSSSESFRSSTSSVRTKSSTTFDSSPVRKIHPLPQVSKSKPAATPPKPLQPVAVSIPEPADGDCDSSFGDMSFDMDALEETLRQYD